MKKVLIVIFVVVLIAVVCFYLTTYTIRQRRLEDANNIMSVNPYRVYKKNMEDEKLQTVIFKIPCPDGYDCPSMIPAQLQQAIESIANDGMKHSIEFNRCSGDSCMNDLKEFLELEGGILDAESYLKDRRR